MDVVVIGGGIQGLLVLDALSQLGYACALVTEGDLGSGQTLHSHGFLNTGFGMLGPELPRALAEVVEPDLGRRGVEVSGEWAAIPPPNVPVPGSLPSATLPDGFAPAFRNGAVRLPDRSFPKRRLIEALSRGLQDRVVVGHATPVLSGDRVEAVAVRLAHTGQDVVLPARAVVVAAGCGSKRLLRSLVGQTPQTEQIKHRRVHMICVRSPRGALPTTSVVAMPLALLVAAHDQGHNVTWYVTPMEFAGPSYDEIPSDAASEVDQGMIARGFAALSTLYPRLSETEGLQLGCYAGYRQDVGDQPGARECALVDGTANVIVALPSGLIGPWLNARRVSELVGAVVDPSGTLPALPGGGLGVRVGTAVEDRADFVWMGWEEWSRTYAPTGTAG